MFPSRRPPLRLFVWMLPLLVTAGGLRPEPGASSPPPEERPAWLIDRPISFSAWRKRETLNYIREHYDPRADSIVIQPTIVVVHWTAINSLEKSWAYFNVERANPRRKALYNAGKVNVGIHFMVGRDGTVLRLMPETWMARHCVGINRHSIGIENVGGPKTPLTDAQLKANVKLIRYLKERHDIRYLIGHSEYLGFDRTRYWEELDPNYRSRKIDPGDDFMRRLRARLRDLGLKSRPGEDVRSKKF